MKRTFTVIEMLALVVSAPLFTTQCTLSWADAKFKKSLALTAIHEDAAAIKVETANGNIEIGRVQAASVEITADIRAITQERLDAVVVRTERKDDRSLRIWLEWPGGKRESNEGASLAIRLPNATAIHAESSNGRIRVNGVGSSADLRTANGNVEVDAIAGDVKARTSNGRIAVREVKGKADLQTMNGSIDLSLEDTASSPFQVATLNGSVSVDVGAAFRGEISASTSNGSIRIHDGKTESSAKSSLSRVIGTGGEKSRITTSNGSVSVRVRGPV